MTCGLWWGEIWGKLECVSLIIVLLLSKCYSYHNATPLALLLSSTSKKEGSVWPVFHFIFMTNQKLWFFSLNLLILKNVDNKFKSIKIDHINYTSQIKYSRGDENGLWPSNLWSLIIWLNWENTGPERYPHITEGRTQRVQWSNSICMTLEEMFHLFEPQLPYV